MYSVGKYLKCTGNKFNFLNIIVMKGIKITPISTKRTITSHLKSLSMEKTTRFDGGNPGTGTTMWSV